jgi:hypothetical protein
MNGLVWIKMNNIATDDDDDDGVYKNNSEKVKNGKTITFVVETYHKNGRK